MSHPAPGLIFQELKSPRFYLLQSQGKRSRKNSYSSLTCYRESHSGSEGDGDGEESPQNSPQMSKAGTKKKGGGRTKKGSAKAVVGRKTSTATQPAPKSQPTTRYVQNRGENKHANLMILCVCGLLQRYLTHCIT